ncbi:hypothetical protein DDE05_19400 [Streptomyces cavourensis]|nr:hypothetical protein DDE05_19400 [Streptomyces cavourensis]
MCRDRGVERRAGRLAGWRVEAHVEAGGGGYEGEVDVDADDVGVGRGLVVTGEPVPVPGFLIHRVFGTSSLGEGMGVVRLGQCRFEGADEGVGVLCGDPAAGGW